MKIAVVANDGSPIGVTEKDIYGEHPDRIGVGGSELGIMTLMRSWVEAGHDVIFFNSPRYKNESCFEQRHVNQFNQNDHYDVAIAFRTPNWKVASSNSGIKIWYSHDQFTSIPFYGFAEQVDKVVGISPFHKQYFKDTYHFDNMTVIDLPVRIYDYADFDPEKKNKNLCIFTSVPDRGLLNMLKYWRAINAIYPEKTLSVTSDYRLWGCETAQNLQYQYIATRGRNVNYLGAIKRKDLVAQQLAASYLLYPCIYDELFCYAIAEALVAGCYAITTDQGACETTNFLNPVPMALFANEIGNAFDLEKTQYIDYEGIRNKAIERFHPDTILKQWETQIFNLKDNT